MELSTLKLTRVSSLLENYAELIASRYKDKLRDARASGALIDSIRQEVVVDGTVFSVVLHLEEYWKYVEEGRLPGSWPPVNAILRWIEVKPVLPAANGLPEPPTLPQLAFLIGRKIYREGIPPNPALGETMDETLPGFIVKLTDAFAKDVRDELEIIFKI